MYSNTRGKLLGLLYLAPALLFVLAFTVYPLIQMVWMSFHNWSILEPARWLGVANYVKAYNDRQFWVSLGFTLKYTLYITPILMGLGFLLALLTAENTRLKKLTRGVIFLPVVIGLAVSSLLWFWLFDQQVGLFNQMLVDVGILDRAITWFTEPTRALWAVIFSITWKVVGFGMILFVASIQSIDREITEAALIDGAGYWQRVQKIILPLCYRTILLATLISVIGSMLAVDQFILMTAGNPRGQTFTSVYWIYQNSFVFFKLGYGSALSIILMLIIFGFAAAQIILTRRRGDR
jgi:multiple sugar transport system permease protein